MRYIVLALIALFPLSAQMDDVHPFLDRLFKNIDQAGLDVSKCEVDHLCYSAATIEEYLEKKKEFSQIAEHLTETVVSGRPYVVYKLRKPVVYKGRQISILEMSAPKVGKKPLSGFEHVEFVTSLSFEEIMARYPHLTFKTSGIHRPVNPELTLVFDDGTLIRFHHQTLEEVVKNEKENPNYANMVAKGRIQQLSLLSDDQLQALSMIPEALYKQAKDFDGAYYEKSQAQMIVGIDGITEVDIADEIYVVKKGDVLMIPVGVKHRFSSKDQTSSLLHLSF